MVSHCLRVWGDFACFTRPEMKVERVSYDVITPSAARAVFDAILWKPALTWVVTKIEVLRPIRWISLRRNEIGAVVSSRTALTAMERGQANLGLYIEEERQQRAGYFLRDVAYRLHAHFRLTSAAGPADNEGKFSEMFERRVAHGQCFTQPYLGCREFSAAFESGSVAQAQPENINADLGWMLYDLDFSSPADPRPLWFRPQLKCGVIEIPPRDSSEVR